MFIVKMVWLFCTVFTCCITLQGAPNERFILYWLSPLSLSNMQTFSAPMKQTTWNHSGKKGAISLLVQMFLTQFNNGTFLYRYIPYFCSDIFKVVSCRVVVCGKGLYLEPYFIFTQHRSSWYNHRFNHGLSLMQTHFNTLQQSTSENNGRNQSQWAIFPLVKMFST